MALHQTGVPTLVALPPAAKQGAFALRSSWAERLRKKAKQSVDVLMVAPPRGHLGGMTAVATLMTEVFPTCGITVESVFTSVAHRGESVLAKATRHARHLAEYARRLRTARPQVVWIHTCSGFSFYHASLHVLCARLLRRRVILHLHGGGFYDFLKRARPWPRAWIRRTLSLCDMLIVLSEGWRRKLREFAPRAEIHVLENAVRVPTSVPSRRKEAVSRFGFLGRLDAEKGVLDLLDAARLLATERLPIAITLAGPAGTAGDLATLTETIRERGLEGVVQIIGPVFGDQKAAFLSSCDAYVQPSHFEGMPLTVLEAFAGGLPVIATSVGALPEMIDQGREGLLVPPHQPRALAEAIRLLACNESLRSHMAAAARERARCRFGVDQFREGLRQLMRRVEPRRWRET
jgi:glycosyltransferase involved in cell wall biosynthesis